MSKLETVVRPFQSREVFTARVLPPVQPPVAPPEPVIVKWGKEITLQARAIGMTDFRSGVLEQETDRVTSTMRVTNPDDAEQYVDVERIEKLFTKDEYGIERTLTLNH